jgi:protein-disulfide isomerase
MKKTQITLLVFMLGAVLAAVPAAAQKASTEGECVGGEANSPARIDVFSDFQCPACQSFYLSTIRQVLATYSRDNKVCVVYHEMPLQQHQYSRPAARYAIAARRVGRLQWIRVADALYSFQGQWSASGDVEGTVAKALSPEDFAKVKEHLKDPSIEAQISRDMAAAQRKQVRSTPTYFITVQGKEQKVVGATQFDILKRYLDSVLPQ